MGAMRAFREDEDGAHYIYFGALALKKATFLFGDLLA